MSIRRSPRGLPQPDFYDVYAHLSYLMEQYPVRVSLVMEPQLGQNGLWSVTLLSVITPRTAVEHTVNAAARPQAIRWEAQWSEKHLLSLPSLVFRGMWELEAALLAQLEQLGLPLT